jgi:acyl-CoA synthetase (AMP-forming)/AMP-acid ligase II
VQDQSLARRIADQIQSTPSASFLRFLPRGEAEGGALSYGDMDVRGRRIGAALLGLGAFQQRLLMVFEPGVEFAEALAGCLYAGAIAIPAPAPRHGATLERLEGIGAGSSAKLILTTAALKARLEAEAAPGSPLAALKLVAMEELDLGAQAAAYPGLDLEPSAPVMVQYTSGSTLEPRGVVLSSATLLANIGLTVRGTGFGRGGAPETFVNWMPHYHDMGLIGSLLIPLVMGFETVQMPPLAFVQNPERWLQAIHRYRGTSSGGPPFAFDLCTKRVSDEALAALDLSSWRIAFCGAEPVYTSTLQAFRSRFAPAGFSRDALVTVYGMAEVAVYVGGSHGPAEPLEAAPALTERAPCYCNEEVLETIRIVSPEGRAMPAGEEGEIWLSGPSVAQGYLDDPEASERTFRNRLTPDDGRLYLRTGDLGTLNGNVLRVTGRAKDVLIRNGANFAARDLERIAAEEQAGLNPDGAAAFQCEGPAAPIVLLLETPKEGWDETAEAETERAVRLAVMNGLGIALDHVGFVPAWSLPRTTSGKIQRARARAAWQERAQ